MVCCQIEDFLFSNILEMLRMAEEEMRQQLWTSAALQ